MEHNSAPLPASSLAPIIDKGEFKYVRISLEIYNNHIKMCKNSLIRCIILSKGEILWKLDDLKAQLTMLWGLNLAWRLISLGRGFYHILLGQHEVKESI